MGRALRIALLALVMVLLNAAPGPIDAIDSSFASPAALADESEQAPATPVASGASNRSVVDAGFVHDRADARTRLVPVALPPLPQRIDTTDLSAPVDGDVSVYSGLAATSRCSRAPPTC